MLPLLLYMDFFFLLFFPNEKAHLKFSNRLAILSCKCNVVLYDSVQDYNT